MKNNRGFAKMFVILLIVVLVGTAGFLILAKMFSKPILVSTPYPPDSVVNNLLVETKTYSNSNAGYQVDYPVNWYAENTDSPVLPSSGVEIFAIQNTKDAILHGSDFGLKSSGSYIGIRVNDKMVSSSYEEYIKSSGLPQEMIAERLANLKMVNIGGKTLQVFTGIKTANSLGKAYSFIYNKKLYSINFVSGSKEQFEKDNKVFNYIISSFKFTN